MKNIPKLTNLQQKLVDQVIINNKPTYIGWTTGSGKSLGALLRAFKIKNLNSNNIWIMTNGQPLVISWGKELNKYNLLDKFEVRCSIINPLIDSSEYFEGLARDILESKGSNKVRVIDYLANKIEIFRLAKASELPILILDEYDTYSSKAKKLLNYIHKVYKVKKSLHKVIYVSATGENSHKLEFKKIYSRKKGDRNVINSIFIPEKNITIKGYTSFNNYFKPKGTVSLENAYTGYDEYKNIFESTIDNAFFETYLHLNGVHGFVDHIVDMFGTRIDATKRNYKCVASSELESEQLQNLCELISEDVVKDKFIQSHYGAGVDYNLNSIYIDYSAFKRYRNLFEIKRDFIQRIGRVNRNSTEKKAIIFVNHCELQDLYKILTSEHDVEIVAEDKEIDIIHYIISKQEYKVRPYVIPFHIQTDKGEKRYAYHTYENRYYEEFKKEGDHYEVMYWEYPTLANIRQAIEERVYLKYSSFARRIEEKIERDKIKEYKTLINRLINLLSNAKTYFNENEEDYEDLYPLDLFETKYYASLKDEELILLISFYSFKNRGCNNNIFSHLQEFKWYCKEKNQYLINKYRDSLKQKESYVKFIKDLEGREIYTLCLYNKDFQEFEKEIMEKKKRKNRKVRKIWI